MIHESVKIHPGAQINCEDLTIGEGSVIGNQCVIEGTKVVIGRDFWMDEGAVIGGGSCFDPCAFLAAGNFLHMGRRSQLNIARGITIGDEVGIGIQTHVFTHGAYLSELDGFPVQFAPVSIGSRVWLPNAWVNPGVVLGNNIVVGAGSLVNKSLPDGCLAGGTPVKILKENFYPKVLSVDQKEDILRSIVAEINMIAQLDIAVLEGTRIVVGNTVFDCDSKTIAGLVSQKTELVRNQLRRHGIRFKYSSVGCNYIGWGS